MIVKTRRWKRPEFRRLIRYVQYGGGRGEVAFEIFHNLDAGADIGVTVPRE